jgi:penicillin-binding protein 1A
MINLNRVFLGESNYGFEAASRSYFGKSSAFLDISEAASLVSIVQAPNSSTYRYDGDNTMIDTRTGKRPKADVVFDRRQRVIDLMSNSGFINQEQKSTARNAPLNIFQKQPDTVYSKKILPHFCNYIIRTELPKIFGTERMLNGDLVVETTLNFDAQSNAEKLLVNSVRRNGSRLGYSQGSLFSLKLNSGEISAMVGGTSGELNRVKSYFQPGSTFKIFTYIAGLEKGTILSKKFSCSPLVLGKQEYLSEQKYDGCKHYNSGTEISLNDGLVSSENVVSMRWAQQIGLQPIVQSACRLGMKFEDRAELKDEKRLKELNDEYQKESQPEAKKKIQSEIDKLSKSYCKFDEASLRPGLVLGETEVRLLDLTPVYATIGNNGIWNPPHGIRRVRDRGKCTNPKSLDTCRVVYDSNSDYPRLSEQKISKSIANALDNTLHNVVKNGTGKLANFEGKEAGKTGTTNDNSDMWFVGYSKNKCIATGVWLGNDTKKSTNGDSSLSAQLWKDYMQELASKDKCQ